jgi:dihydropteroate synthase
VTAIDLEALDRRRSRRTLVMGIVNVTPDSFSDGGDYLAAEAAIAQAAALFEEGADIVDIGGESTRPGAEETSRDDELGRVLPVLSGVAGQVPRMLSIDTYKVSVAEAALQAGARIVNDVWGLQREPEIARVASAHGAAVVIGHWEREARYRLSEILDAMKRFFDRSIGIARSAGIPDAHILLDPGIGFGKDGAQNLLVLDRLDEIVALGFAVVVGTSRKRFIGDITGRPPKERLAGTIASHVIAAERGASIVRVHDVRAHRDALAVTDAILASRRDA